MLITCMHAHTVQTFSNINQFFGGAGSGWSKEFNKAQESVARVAAAAKDVKVNCLSKLFMLI